MLPMMRPPFGPAGTATATIVGDLLRQKARGKRQKAKVKDVHAANCFHFWFLPFAFILDFYEPFAHEVTLAADADGCNLVAASLDSDFNEARSAHLDSLLADDLGYRV